MDKLKNLLFQVRQAGKLDQIILYGEIINLSQQQAPEKLYSYFEELIVLYKNYLDFDSKPPKDVVESFAASLLTVFSQIRDTADIPAFDKYEKLFTQEKLLLTNPASLARIYQVFGYMYWLKNELEKSVHYLHTSITILNENNIIEDFPERYSNLGFVYEYMGDYKQAEKLYKEGLKFAKKHNCEKALISSYSGMGRLNLQLKRYQTAVEYLECNLALVKDKGMNRELATIMVNLAIAYLNLKNYDKALELNLQLDTKILKENDQELYYTVILNTGCCFADKGDYDKAKPYFKKANSYALKKNDIPQMIFSLINLGRISKLEFDFNKALDYLNQALPLSEKANSPRQLLDIHGLIGEVFLLQNNYTNAITHYQKAVQINDSIPELLPDPDLTKALSTCYEKTGDFENAYKSLLVSQNLREEAKHKKVEPDEEIKSNKQLANGKKSHYIFSESTSLISMELTEKIGQWLIGTSKEMQEILEKVYIAAQNKQVNVLLHGESGTGKELIAKLIHYAGERSGFPFIEINSAVFTTSLAESSLFGHKKGAFTGASENHIGYFESAQNGTLFLDEISEMPMEFQSMILRVLETKQIKPLGSSSLVKVDFRLICASNQNIRKLTESKHFRFDLFNRINSLEIEVPPLREHKSDIPLLINYFLNNLSQEMNIKTPAFSSKAIDKLCDYHYPGNIRELKNIIQRLLLFNKKDIIESEDIILTEETNPALNLKEEDWDLVSNEKRLILAALIKTNGIVSNAARILGISQFALARRVKKYNLDKNISLN